MKAVSLVLVVLAFVAAAFAAPTWPNQYLVAGTFSIPYFDIVEPVRVVFDAANTRERIDYYHGQDSFIYTPATNYELVPRINKRICMTNPGSSDDLVAVLPDLADWQSMGVVTRRGQQCNHFQKVVKSLNVTSTYDFYATASNNYPVQLVMAGYNFVFGSHPDVYIFDYDQYVPGYNHPAEFEIPDLCKTSVTGTGVSARRGAQLLRALTPYTRNYDALFAEHMNRYGKQYTGAEAQRRQAIFNRNQRFIDEYNMYRAPHTGITLKMNHHGDLEHDEFRSIMLPKRGRVSENNGASAVHEVVKTAPKSIDWRTLGAVNMVKDQGACGSCWTFGTTGTLEGTYFVKHGQLPNLAEQQIVDCAWGDRYLQSMGCDGGQTAGALQWIIDNGGIATERSYHYDMQDGYCRNDTTSGVQVASYVNVTMGDENALMNAVGTVGPVAIAIDAAHEEFEYYSTGVYYNPACKNGFNDLDHEVLAVGYGTTDDGQDYWIVKNSWSTHWGDQGYIKMARNRDNNCGVATDAVYPIPV